MVAHLLREGSTPIVTELDCTKAFNLCRLSTLFERVLEKGMPPVVVRVLAYMHEEL